MSLLCTAACMCVYVRCSDLERELDEHKAELSSMRTYLAESESLSQSTDVLRKEIVHLKDKIEVSVTRHTTGGISALMLVVDECIVCACCLSVVSEVCGQRSSDCRLASYSRLLAVDRV